MNWSSMRRHARPLVLSSVMAAIGLFAFQPASAQATLRKVKNRIDPVYPDLAKRNNIHGSARVELLITTDGRVKDVRVLGGNPVLVDAVVTAVMKKTEPKPEPRPLAVSAEGHFPGTPPGTPTFRAIIVGDGDFASNSFLPYLSNSDFALGGVRWLLREEHGPVVASRIPVPPMILLSGTQMKWIFLLVEVLLPLSVFVLGGLVWWRRR